MWSHVRNFVQTNADKSRDVRNTLNSSRQKAVEENRNRLSHIIRTIEFCGRQEIPLRGNRDAGAFSLNETDCNDGVFKAALRLRVEAADKQTSDLFLKAPRNASYLSWSFIFIRYDSVCRDGLLVRESERCHVLSWPNKHAWVAPRTSGRASVPVQSLISKFLWRHLSVPCAIICKVSDMSAKLCLLPLLRIC